MFLTMSKEKIDLISSPLFYGCMQGSLNSFPQTGLTSLLSAVDEVNTLFQEDEHADYLFSLKCVLYMHVFYFCGTAFSFVNAWPLCIVSELPNLSPLGLRRDLTHMLDLLLISTTLVPASPLWSFPSWFATTGLRSLL